MAASSPVQAEPSIDEIVARVLAEAARRRGAAPAPAAAPDWAQLASRAGLGTFRPLAPEAPIAFVPRADRNYAAADFFVFHGGAFVEACYRGVLGREADAIGRQHYLAQLLAGTSRLEVLTRLRYSSEGRRFGARVAGLALAAPLVFAGRIPVLGYAARWLLALARLPRTVRALDALDARAALDHERIGDIVARLDGHGGGR
jgi:Domain of unknown function (DUF4214)